MRLIISLSVADFAALSEGQRVAAYDNIVIEIEKKITKESKRKASRAVRKSTPAVSQKCPQCKGKMFIDDSCCRNCDGSGSIVVRPEITVGDTVVIKSFIMQPWGWLKYPRPTNVRDRIDIPTGTPAFVVYVGPDKDPNFMVDCVIKDRLYRLTIEGQYIQV